MNMERKERQRGAATNLSGTDLMPMQEVRLLDTALNRCEAERKETMIRVSAPHFTAGLILNDTSDMVVHAAPIVRYMIGWPPAKVVEYCKKKGWSYDLLIPHRP